MDLCYIPGPDPSTCPACQHRSMSEPHYGTRTGLWIRICLACGISTFTKTAPASSAPLPVLVRPAETVYRPPPAGLREIAETQRALFDVRRRRAREGDGA